MIRSVWFVGWLLVDTFFFGTVAIVSGLLGLRAPKSAVYDWCARGWSRGLLWAAGTPVRVKGMERVPNRPVVFVSNHQSWFDIFMLAGFLPGTVRFLAKQELSRVPVLGRAMRSAGHIFIDRANRQAAFGSYDAAAGQIRDGMSAVVFAEGTRSPTGQLLPFKKGPFVLAIASGAPVVPVYCANTFDVLPKRTICIRSHAIELRIGDPIATDSYDYETRDALMRVVRAAIERLREGAEGDRVAQAGPPGSPAEEGAPVPEA